VLVVVPRSTGQRFSSAILAARNNKSPRFVVRGLKIARADRRAVLSHECFSLSQESPVGLLRQQARSLPSRKGITHELTISYTSTLGLSLHSLLVLPSEMNQLYLPPGYTPRRKPLSQQGVIYNTENKSALPSLLSSNVILATRLANTPSFVVVVVRPMLRPCHAPANGSRCHRTSSVCRKRECGAAFRIHRTTGTGNPGDCYRRGPNEWSFH